MMNFNQNHNLKIGNAPCSWGVFYPNDNIFQPTEYLNALSELNYEFTEMGPFGYFGKYSEEIKVELDKRNLQLSGATYVYTLANFSTNEKFYSEIDKICKILVSLNSKNFILMDDSEFYSKEAKRKINHKDWSSIMKTVIKAQNIVENYHGLKMHFHPHVGTFVQYENEIDQLLNDTNVSICFDTGHHAFWDQEPLNYLKKIYSRVGYIHLKNVNNTIRKKVWNFELSIDESFENGVMCSLQHGLVNIREIIQFLLSRNFVGFCIIEQDPEKNKHFNPKKLAKENLDLVKDEIENYNNRNEL